MLVPSHISLNHHQQHQLSLVILIQFEADAKRKNRRNQNPPDATSPSSSRADTKKPTTSVSQLPATADFEPSLVSTFFEKKEVEKATARDPISKQQLQLLRADHISRASSPTPKPPSASVSLVVVIHASRPIIPSTTTKTTTTTTLFPEYTSKHIISVFVLFFDWIWSAAYFPVADTASAKRTFVFSGLTSPRQQQFVFLFLSSLLAVVFNAMTTQFTKLFSFILACVHDPPPEQHLAFRLHCHSCMSPYLEDQFQFISHLYRRPLVFSDKCDQNNFDWRYVDQKNCTDACITLRMNDKVGGRRRFGYMRGCLSDIIHYNRSSIRTTELSRTARLDTSICSAIRLRDLFVMADRFSFDPHDYVDLCTCLRSGCNSASVNRRTAFLLMSLPFLAAVFTLLQPAANGGSRPMSRRGAESEIFFRKNNDLPVRKGAAKECDEDSLRSMKRPLFGGRDSASENRRKLGVKRKRKSRLARTRL